MHTAQRSTSTQLAPDLQPLNTCFKVDQVEEDRTRDIIWTLTGVIRDVYVGKKPILRIFKQLEITTYPYYVGSWGLSALTPRQMPHIPKMHSL